MLLELKEKKQEMQFENFVIGLDLLLVYPCGGKYRIDEILCILWLCMKRRNFFINYEEMSYVAHYLCQDDLAFITGNSTKKGRSEISKQRQLFFHSESWITSAQLRTYSPIFVNMLKTFRDYFLSSKEMLKLLNECFLVCAQMQNPNLLIWLEIFENKLNLPNARFFLAYRNDFSANSKKIFHQAMKLIKIFYFDDPNFEKFVSTIEEENFLLFPKKKILFTRYSRKMDNRVKQLK